MGGNTSLSFKEYVNTQINNTIDSSTVISNKAGTQQTVINTQIQNIAIAGPGCCKDYTTDDYRFKCQQLLVLGNAGCDGDVDVKATLNASVKAVNTSNSEVANSTSSSLSSLLSSELSAVQTQMNSATFPTIGNNSKQDTLINLQTEMTNVIKNTTSESNIAEIRSNTFDTQGQTINVCSHVNGSCKFSADLFATIFASNIATQVVTNITDSTLAQQMYSAVQTNNSQTKTDAIAVFAQAIGDFFKSVAGIVLIVGLFIFLIIFLVIRGMFGHHSSGSSGPTAAELIGVAKAASAKPASAKPASAPTKPVPVAS